MAARPSLPQLLTIDETAQFLKLHRSSIYRLQDEDPNFPEPVRVGRSPRFYAQELVAYLARHRHEAA